MGIVDQKQFFKDLYASIEKNCSAERLNRFASLATDVERFQFIHDLSGIEKFAGLRSQTTGKNADEALLLKKQGNEKFQRQDYASALDLYTASQLLTPTENGNLKINVNYKIEEKNYCLYLIVRICS